MIKYYKSHKEKIIESIQRNKALLIDFDGTLINFEINERKALEKLFSEIEIPLKLHTQAIKDYRTFSFKHWSQYELGKITLGEARKRGFEDLITTYNLKWDSKELNNMFLRFFVQTSEIDEKIVNSLKNLKKLDSKLIIITNGDQWSQSQRLINSGLMKIIDDYFISESVGYAKPHPKMFNEPKKFLKSVNYPTNDIWVIGDNFETDIRGGFNAGLNTCWITSNKLETSLSTFESEKFEEALPTLSTNTFLEFVEFYKEIKEKE